MQKVNFAHVLRYIYLISQLGCCTTALCQGLFQLCNVPFTVFINGSMTELNRHSFAIAFNGLTVPCPSLADDISLFDLYPSSLQSSMDNCYDYSLNWRYEFNHTKIVWSLLVTIKEPEKSQMNEREWKLGSKKVDELYEYKNLGVTK